MEIILQNPVETGIITPDLHQKTMLVQIRIIDNLGRQKEVLIGYNDAENLFDFGLQKIAVAEELHAAFNILLDKYEPGRIAQKLDMYKLKNGKYKNIVDFKPVRF